MKQNNKKFIITKLCILAVSMYVLSGCSNKDDVERVTEATKVLEETKETEEMQSVEEVVQVNNVKVHI